MYRCRVKGRMIHKIKNLEIIKNRYFVLGSVIGKGASILALPLIVLYFSATTYAFYVLLYSYVQFIALISSLGVTNALIPFWLEYDDKAEFLASLVNLMVGISVIIYVPMAFILFFLVPIPADILEPFVTMILILSYASGLNFFAIGQFLIRVQSKQLSFFWIGIASLILLIILLFLFRYSTGNKLLILTLINIVVLLFQAILCFKFAGVPFRFAIKRSKLEFFSKTILKFSGPLTVYMLIGLIPCVVDKWIVNKYFSISTFSEYALNFQFAFAVNIVSNVINIYNSPRVCELYHLNDNNGLNSNLKTNYVLVLFGTLCIGLALFIYASITNIYLTMGYWILILAFLFSNLFAVNTNFLIAEKRANLLALIGGIGTLCFLCIMILAIFYNTTSWIYFSHLFYYVFLTLSSFLAIRGNFLSFAWPVRKT